MGAEIPMKYVMEKLKENERELGEDDWVNLVVEKLKEWLVALEDFAGSLIGKADEAFPPEKRGDLVEQLKHWLVAATPFLIAAAVLLMCICCCRRCCCRGGGRGVRMMKAPGRGYWMPRDPFEANPRSYFRGLRGKSSVTLV